MDFRPSGIIPPIVTPLTNDGELHEAVLQRLVDYVIEGGVHGIFAAGTTGEFYGLTPEDKRRLWQMTVRAVRGRVPVYAGTGAITTRESVQLGRLAEDCGVDALSVLTPMFLSPSQEELVAHYTAIAKATRLPVVLYNNLPKTGVTITADSAERLSLIDNIVGIKDSSGDLTLTGEYIRRTRANEFAVLAGRDTLIHACLCYGGSGAIAACANVAPRLVSDIYDKFISGDREGSLEAQYRLAPLRIAFGLGTFPVVIKEALRMIGIDAGPCMAPAGPMSPTDRERLQKVLVDMGLR